MEIEQRPTRRDHDGGGPGLGGSGSWRSPSLANGGGHRWVRVGSRSRCRLGIGRYGEVGDIRRVAAWSTRVPIAGLICGREARKRSAVRCRLFLLGAILKIK
jgi:hypothetical protein